MTDSASLTEALNEGVAQRDGEGNWLLCHTFCYKWCSRQQCSSECPVCSWLGSCEMAERSIEAIFRRTFGYAKAYSDDR